MWVHSSFAWLSGERKKRLQRQTEAKQWNISNDNRSSNSTGASRSENAMQKLTRENVNHLIQQLEAGNSEARSAYLTAMSRFHNYSFGNILQIAWQRPDAQRVAGLYAWNKLGRRVKRGEKDIQILAPMTKEAIHFNITIEPISKLGVCRSQIALAQDQSGMPGSKCTGRETLEKESIPIET